jgi:hypothetical protein
MLRLCYYPVTMVRGAFLPVALFFCNILTAKDLSLCYENRAKVDPDTLAEFRLEIETIFRLSGMQLQISECSARKADLNLTIQTQSAAEPSALGAARTSGTRILPEIEVYTRSLSALLQVRLPALLGRAMARVAAHEAGHYLTQSSAHPGGLMSESFSAPRLMAARPGSFRIPVPRTSLD